MLNNPSHYKLTRHESACKRKKRKRFKKVLKLYENEKRLKELLIVIKKRKSA